MRILAHSALRQSSGGRPLRSSLSRIVSFVAAVAVGAAVLSAPFSRICWIGSTRKQSAARTNIRSGRLRSCVGSAALGARVSRGARLRLLAVNGNGDDDHAQAVSRWIDRLIVGHRFCPWAIPAREEGRIRVVTSSSTTEDGVLDDLLAEADALPKEREPPSGCATTTVVVCPNVKAWEDFGAFEAFYGGRLQNGDALMEDEGVKIVAFHPGFVCTPYSGVALQAGDVVAIPRFGTSGTRPECVLATVKTEIVGEDDDGVEMFSVKHASGEEELVRYDDFVDFLLRGEGSEHHYAGPGGGSASIAHRAPRPALHLLRVRDLEVAHADGGEASEAAVLANEETAESMGLDAAAELLRNCG